MHDARLTVVQLLALFSVLDGSAQERDLTCQANKQPWKLALGGWPAHHHLGGPPLDCDHSFHHAAAARFQDTRGLGSAKAAWAVLPTTRNKLWPGTRATIIDACRRGQLSPRCHPATKVVPFRRRRCVSLISSVSGLGASSGVRRQVLLVLLVLQGMCVVPACQLLQDCRTKGPRTHSDTVPAQRLQPASFWPRPIDPTLLCTPYRLELAEVATQAWLWRGVPRNLRRRRAPRSYRDLCNKGDT